MNRAYELKKNYYKISFLLILEFEKSESKETSAMAVSAESIFSKVTKPTLKQNIKETQLHTEVFLREHRHRVLTEST